MACIVKRRNRWTLDYRDQHGLRRKEVVKGTKKDAEALLAQRLQEIGRGEYQARTQQKTFDALANAYIDVNIRDSTAADYRTNLRLHLKHFFAGMRLRDISPETVECW